jgi:hypothetical protein
MVIANEKRYENIPEMLRDYWVNHVRFVGKELFANINDLYIDVGLPKTNEHLFNSQYVYDTAKWLKECKDQNISPKDLYRSLQETLGQYINFGVDFFTHFYKQADMIVRLYDDHEFSNFYLPLAIEKDIQSDYPVELSQVQSKPIQPVKVEGLEDLSGIDNLIVAKRHSPKQSKSFSVYQYGNDNDAAKSKSVPQYPTDRRDRDVIFLHGGDAQFRTKRESEDFNHVEVETTDKPVEPVKTVESVEAVETVKDEVIVPTEKTLPEVHSEEVSLPIEKILRPEEVLSQLDKTKSVSSEKMGFAKWPGVQQVGIIEVSEFKDVEVNELKEEVPPSQGETLLLEETQDEIQPTEVKVEEQPVTFDENDYLVYDQNNVQLRYTELLKAKGIAMDNHDDEMVSQIKFVMNATDGNGNVLLNYTTRGFVSIIKKINNHEYYKSEGEVDGLE